MTTLQIGDIVHGEKFVYDRWYMADGPIQRIIVEPLRTFVYINGDAYDESDVTLVKHSAPTPALSAPTTPYTPMDIDSGLGIGGINNDQSMPIIPTVAAIARVQRMHDTDTICRRCGASKNFDGAMFTTLGGSNICDDCA